MDPTHARSYEGVTLAGAPAHSSAFEEEPPRSLHAGEEEEHEKKPVLKKVKEKVKKIKSKLKPHGHEQEQDHEVEDEEEEEDGDGYEKDDEEPEVDPEVHGGPMDEELARKQEESPKREETPLENTKESFEEDPAAPMSCSQPRRGGEEVGLSPILHSFEAMAVSDHPQSESKTGEEAKPVDTTKESAMQSYTEKLSSATAAAKGAAVSAAVGSAEYGKRIASTVYDRVSGAGAAVKEKTIGGGSTGLEGEQAVQPDKGVSVKTFLAEKLKPGEEDRALSEVISEAIHKKDEGDEKKERERNVEEKKVVGSCERAPGVVEKIRGTVTSLFSSGGVSTVSHPKPADVAEGSREAPEGEKLKEDDLQ